MQALLEERSLEQDAQMDKLTFKIDGQNDDFENQVKELKDEIDRVIDEISKQNDLKFQKFQDNSQNEIQNMIKRLESLESQINVGITVERIQELE